MSSRNLCIFLGRLGNDPELNQTKTGTAYCKFSLATEEKYREKTTVTWVPCIAWGKRAELISKYCRKGNLVYVEGKFDSNEYKDKNGNQRRDVTIRIDQIQFFNNRSSEAEAMTETDYGDL